MKLSLEVTPMSVVRATALVVIECRGALPNGDPDWANRPRQRIDGRGWISAVCLKSKIRNLLADHTSEAFAEIAKHLDFNPKQFFIWESLRKNSSEFDPERTYEIAMAAMSLSPLEILQTFWDSRVFGATILPEDPEKVKKKKDAEKKRKEKRQRQQQGAPVEEEPVVEEPPAADNGGALPFKAGNLVKTGPVTMTDAISVDPVEIVEATITKRAPLREDNLVKKTGDMAPLGRKFVEHGIYISRVGVNPHVAKNSLATPEDIRVYQYLLTKMFALDASAARPAGSLTVKHVWWAEHKSVLGDFSEPAFWEACQPVRGEDGEYVFPTPPKNFKAVDLMQVPLSHFQNGK